MRHFAPAIVASLLVASSTSAQPNPFKTPKPDIKGAAVSYTMTGDMQGTANVAYDGERYLRASKSTMKIMGKTSSVDDWVLTTADSMWRADLTKKEGTVAPNMMPRMAKAYDDLDGDGKKRFHQNMQDMSALMGRAFGFGNLNSGKRESPGRRGSGGGGTGAGPILVCQMTKAPLVLHTSSA
jgi:hypothetical protein